MLAVVHALYLPRTAQEAAVLCRSAATAATLTEVLNGLSKIERDLERIARLQAEIDTLKVKTMGRRASRKRENGVTVCRTQTLAKVITTRFDR